MAPWTSQKLADSLTSLTKEVQARHQLLAREFDGAKSTESVEEFYKARFSVQDSRGLPYWPCWVAMLHQNGLKNEEVRCRLGEQHEHYLGDEFAILRFLKGVFRGGGCRVESRD